MNGIKALLSVAIIFTFFSILPKAEAGGFSLGANETLNTDNMVKNMLGFKDNSVNVILQYLLPKDLLTPNEDNGPVSSWQIDLGNDINDLRITVHYTLSF